jgi:diguanylate cyclase (GGDEF)-like protein
VKAALSRWRAGSTEDDVGRASLAGAWLSRVSVGRTAAVLFVLCGASSLASVARPAASGGQSSGAYVAVAVAAGAGLLSWCLPWSRWPRRAGYFLIPAGFALVALQSALASPDAVVYSVFFVLLFAWIGVAFPQGTALMALTLFAAAYLLPLVLLGQFSGITVDSALYVGVACLLVGETLALLSTKLRLNQAALWRARAAVNDIGAELASTADPEKLWSSMALRLSELVGLPDCDVYRLMEDGSLVCLASVYDEKPCPEWLRVCTQQDVWAADREAVRTREPVFIASPADPRLGPAEREDMRRWQEQAMLIVPLVARDEVIGLVEISETREGRSIAPEQIATVVSICRLIAMALHDADTMHMQEERARRLASLFESSRAVASAASMEEALAVVTRCAGEVFGVSECVAYEHDPEHDAVVARAMWERTPSGWDRLGEPSPLAEDPMSRAVLESGQPFLGLLSDPQLDPVSRADLEQWGEKSCLTIPMQSSDGPTGLLNLWDREQERTYTDGEMALATSLAELAGEAVRGAKLLRRLRSLSESDPLTGLANHRKLYEFLAHEQARAERYGSHFSLVMLDIDEFKLLNDTHGHPAGDAILRQVGTLLTEQTRAADVVGRYGGDEFLLVLPETTAAEAGLFAEKLRAALVANPYVTTAGEQIPIRASFGIAAYPEDVPDANGLVALADANLYASKRRGGDAITGVEEERSLREAEGGTFSLFESLVTAVDNKDRYTRRHSEEVTEYALAISRALGLSEESQRVLRVAALLHDVGKIGIPDRILRKPGRLSEGEYEVVKGHPLLAETIIAAIPDVEEIRAAVASHHERYDGDGYPHGLAKDAIPLLGRIMAVADTYSAMTTDRPYRKALSREEAIAELHACSGTQFDPEIVETFIACIERGVDFATGAAREPFVEAGVLQVTADRDTVNGEPTTDGPTTDGPTTDGPTVDGPTARTWPASRESCAIDQAEMRSRIEETRTRLKVKAFDAMIGGEAALLGRGGGENPVPSFEDRALDGHLKSLVDEVLSEEDS